MAESLYSIGVDVGGTNLKFAAISEAGAIVARQTIPTDGHEGHDPVLERMIQGVRSILKQLPPNTTIEAVGVGVPGMVDMTTGTVLDLPNLAGRWTNVRCGEIMQTGLGRPVYLINDVKAFSLAELQYGSARNASTAICYAIGTGIGGGIVFDGQVHFGVGGAAGEFGHIIVNPGGILCSCGNRGCVEALASGPAIIGEANRRVVQGFTTRLTELVGDDLNRMTPAIVEEAAADGDAIARDVLEQAGYYLGLSMAGIIAAVAPDTVVIGGGVVQPGGVYWHAFESTARANNTVTEMDRVSFVPAALGYEAGVIGAALWGRQVQRGLATPVR